MSDEFQGVHLRWMFGVLCGCLTSLAGVFRAVTLIDCSYIQKVLEFPKPDMKDTNSDFEP